MVTVPIYDMLVLPGLVFHFKDEVCQTIGMSGMKTGEEIIFLLMKEDKKPQDMTADDIFPIGVSGIVESVDNDGDIKIRMLHRVSLDEIDVSDGKVEVTAAVREDIDDMDEEEQNMHLSMLKDELLKYAQQYPWGMLARGYILHWKSIAEIFASTAPYLMLTQEERYRIIAEDSVRERMLLMEQSVYELIDMTRAGQDAEAQQKEKNEKIYRESALKKQIEILQGQLNEMHPESVTDIQKFEEKISQSGMNETARKEAEKVLHRMKQEGEQGHEYAMLYDYLDFVTGLSWKKEEMEEVDLEQAEEILDRDHYGMKKVKQRIIQQMALMALNKKQSGSILLFAGTPGTGKTSIGQGIAEALGRKYVRVSLGGVRDEAEIRGHRRTYVGAMPGRIMAGMKQCGCSNPVMVLDEVDKLSKDFSGDPASALLEVLDSEQNNSFTDHYMNVPYDLSDVLFVCTANTTDTIPEPLLNRMEVISFPGYTASEKFQIAKRHLIPKAMKKMGIKAQNMKITDDAIRALIAGYTAESGVRGLGRQIDALCRYAAVKLVKGRQKSITVSPKRLPEFLDQSPIRHEQVLEKKQPGIVTGLAWTQAGGEILFIETLLTKGSGKVQVTGQLGDVMKESVQIAVSLVKSLYPEEAKVLEESDLHIHVPAGAVPKDGPSAGITLTTAVASLLTGRPVSPKYAMTGEISLRGRVMPIGGLPEKLMAAQRAGIEKVLIPQENIEDLKDVADEVKEKLEIIPVKEIGDVLKEVLGEK